MFAAMWDEICILLGCYTACSGKSLPTFRDKASVPSSGAKKSKENLRMERIGCPEKSVRISHHTLCNNSDDRRSKTELRLTDLFLIFVLLYKVSPKFGSEGLAPYFRPTGRSLKPKALLPRQLYGDNYKHLAPPSES